MHVNTGTFRCTGEVSSFRFQFLAQQILNTEFLLPVHAGGAGRTCIHLPGDVPGTQPEPPSWNQPGREDAVHLETPSLCDILSLLPFFSLSPVLFLVEFEAD